MKKVSILFAIVLFALHAQSQIINQTRKIFGHVYDRDNGIPLPGASISCLSVKDPTRIKSVFSEKSGFFMIDSLLPGKYVLSLTYIGYKSHLDSITIPIIGNSVIIDSIFLEKKILTLTSVEIIESKKMVSIKKDTLEFSANQFTVRENSNVEELLKKIPGIEILNDGSIKINGEAINKILVNGREFFFNDPKLASQNILAEVIDKIQIIDKKKQTLSPDNINGSPIEKIINITIKDNKTNQILGEISSSYGQEGKFALKISPSRFSAKQQLGLIMRGNNINGFTDGKVEENDGFSKSWKVAANYSKDINDRITLNGNYIVDDSRSNFLRNTIRQNLLLDSNMNNQHSKSGNHFSNHTATIKILYKIDSLTTFTITNFSAFKKNNGTEVGTYQTSNKYMPILNSGITRNHIQGYDYSIYNNLLLEKRIGSKGQFLHMDIGYSINKTNGVSENVSENAYNQSSGETIADTINRQRKTTGNNNLLQLSLSFTEPILNNHLLTLTYAYTMFTTPSNSVMLDYNIATGTFSIPNDSLSNSFKNISKYHYSGLSIATSKLKYDYSISLNMLTGTMNNYNNNKNSIAKLRNTILLPNVNFNYFVTNTSRLNFSYLISPELPDISQIQPVIDNTNPLIINIGNENLKPFRTHNLLISYNNLNKKTLEYTSLTINAEFLNKKIITATWMDSLGRQVNQPVNKDGSYTIKFNINNVIPLKNKNNKIKLSTIVNYNHDVTYWDGADGYSKTLGGSQSISFNYLYKKVLDFSISASINYSRLQYPNTELKSSNLFNYRFSSDWNTNLPLGFAVGGNLKYALSTGRTIGYNMNTWLLNIFLSKTLLNNKRMITRAQGFNLLNSTENYRRFVGSSYIEDSYSEGLQRFFMISISYFLKK